MRALITLIICIAFIMSFMFHTYGLPDIGKGVHAETSEGCKVVIEDGNKTYSYFYDDDGTVIGWELIEY